MLRLSPSLVSSSVAEAQCCFLFFRAPLLRFTSRCPGEEPWLWLQIAIYRALMCHAVPVAFFFDSSVDPQFVQQHVNSSQQHRPIWPSGWTACSPWPTSQRCKTLKALVFETWLKNPHPSGRHLFVHHGKEASCFELRVCESGCYTPIWVA